MIDKIDMVLERIKDLKKDNKEEHGKMQKHLMNLNDSVAKIKTKYIIIGTALITAMVVLVAVGRLPEGVMKVVQKIISLLT